MYIYHNRKNNGLKQSVFYIMKITIEKKNRITTPGVHDSMFPGAALLPDGKILLLYNSGSGFEAGDCRMYKAWSLDQGESFQFDGVMYEPGLVPFDLPFTVCVKPTVLDHGEILAVGYGYLRDKPEMGLSDYAEQYGRFPQVKNITLRSRDNGRTWDRLEVIDHEFEGLELSGPAVMGQDGKLHFFAAPFVLKSDMQSGLSYESSDRGHTWQRTGTFFRSSDIAPWEVRAMQMPNGRIVLIMWLFDLKKQTHCNTALVWSDDFGKTWSAPCDTGLRGQASNMLLYRGELYLLQARREGDHPGIFLNKASFDAQDRVVVGPDCCVWDAAGQASRGDRIEQQFLTMRFGQPSALMLKDGTCLLFFWHCDGISYSVQAWKIKIEE